MAKAIALGAHLGGLALPFLQAAVESEESLNLLVDILIAEITTVLFCTGNANLLELKKSRTCAGGFDIGETGSGGSTSSGGKNSMSSLVS